MDTHRSGDARSQLWVTLVALALSASLWGCTDIEGNQPGECTDRADNDSDGDFDCADSDCAGSPDCTDGVDDDDSGDEGGPVLTRHPRCEAWPATIFTDPESHSGDLIIGSVFDGGDFPLMVRAARLAVMQANDRGGLGGRPLGIVECTSQQSAQFDTLTTSEATVEVGQYLVDEVGVPAIIGPATSARAELAYNALSPQGTLLVSPSATSPALTAIDGATSTDAAPGLFWRTAPPDSLQGQVIAQQMLVQLGATSAAVIHQTGPYGEGLAEVFVDNFVGDGRTADSLPFSDGTELATHIATAGEPTAGYDQVLFISAQAADAVDFLNAAAGLSGYATMGIFLTDAARATQLLESTAGTADALYANVRGTSPAGLGGAVYDSFAAAYGAAHDGEDPGDFWYSAHAWDAGWLALLGAAWADTREAEITGTTMARGLRQISSGTAMDLGGASWASARATFATGATVDIRGASGALDYDPDTGETTAPILVWQIDAAGTGFEDIDCVDLSDSASLCPDL